MICKFNKLFAIPCCFCLFYTFVYGLRLHCCIRIVQKKLNKNALKVKLKIVKHAEKGSFLHKDKIVFK